MKTTDEQKIIIVNLAKEGYSCGDIHRKTNIDRNTIYHLLKRRNIPINFRRSRTYFSDFHKFDSIDNEEKAYWLGFILGDGSVRNTSLIISLSDIDKEHLYKFQKFMESNSPIKSVAKNCSSIYINNKYLVNSLKKYSIIRNKTYKNVLTPSIDNDLLSHFYRGVLDADGWLCEHKSKRGKSYDIGFSSYSYDFLKEIQTWINTKLNNKNGYLIERFRANNTQRVCQLTFGGNKLFLSIVNLLYDNAIIYLDRKYEKYLKFSEEIKTKVDGRTTHFRL